MILLGLVTFLHLPLLIQSYTAHLSDALKLKCDALPYRTSYSEYRCYFAVLRKIEYSKSAKECSSIFAGSKIAIGVPALAFRAMMLNMEDFHTDSASTGVKYTICAVEVEYQCESDSYMLSSGRCVTRAAKKMNFADAVNYCQNLGMTLPSPANDRDNLIVRDALWNDPAWVQRYAIKENLFKWRQGNDFSMWSTCDRPGGYNPRLYAASQNSLWSCAKNTASVVDKGGYWSNAGTDYLMDVVCMKPATNAFSSVAASCNYYDMTVSMGIAKNPVVRMRTCYVPTLTKTRYQVIDRVTVETQRGCEVACDNHSACAAFVFKDAGFTSKCTLLAEMNANEDCGVSTTVFLKKSTGCVDRTNFTAEFGIDPCIDAIVPSVFRGFGQWKVCENTKDKVYIVRAIDENGKRITLDNDRLNWVEQSGDMWVWKYGHENTQMRVIAFACVEAGGTKCPCEPYRLLTEATDRPIYPAAPDRINPCNSTGSSWLWYNTAKTEKLSNQLFQTRWLTQWDTARSYLTCKAGMWIIWRESDWNSWGVTALACYL